MQQEGGRGTRREDALKRLSPPAIYGSLVPIVSLSSAAASCPFIPAWPVWALTRQEFTPTVFSAWLGEPRRGPTVFGSELLQASLQKCMPTILCLLFPCQSRNKVPCSAPWDWWWRRAALLEAKGRRAFETRENLLFYGGTSPVLSAADEEIVWIILNPFLSLGQSRVPLKQTFEDGPYFKLLPQCNQFYFSFPIPAHRPPVFP